MAKANDSIIRNLPWLKAGNRFGLLEAVRFVDRDDRGRQRWQFKCDCGGVVVVPAGNIQSGNTKSCGCRKVAALKEASVNRTTHGMTGSPEYVVWSNMIDRCENPNVSNYKKYGAKGVAVCNRWRSSFEAFYADMGPRPSLDYSIDRFPNRTGNYEPDNCRWATATEQARNMTTNIVVMYLGRDMCLKEACELENVPYMRVYQRLKSGWTLERAFSEPSHGNWRTRCKTSPWI